MNCRIARRHVPLAVLAAVLLGACARPTPLEHATLVHGPFTIVAEGRRISTGAFPNNGGNPFATMEVTGFEIRWHDRPVTITHGHGTLATFWRVMRLTDAPQPALLASTTDFHLVTEVDGQLVTRSFGEPSTSFAEVQWLDAADGQPTPPQGFGIEKVDVGSGTELRGGRWLRLAEHTILDVRTLTPSPVRQFIPDGSGRPLEGLGSGGPARVFSPGKTQYVLVGSGYDRERDGEFYEALLVVDVPTGEAYGLRADRRRTRFMEADDVTPAWLDHYYRWTRDAHGERLVPRPDAKPLPWRGRFTGSDARRPEYRLRPVRREMERVMATFLTTTMGGALTDDWVDPTRPRGSTFTVPGCDGVIAISSHGGEVGVYSPAPVGRPATECPDTVRAIGERFDAELVRGAHQDLFVDDPKDDPPAD